MLESKACLKEASAGKARQACGCAPASKMRVMPQAAPRKCDLPMGRAGAWLGSAVRERPLQASLDLGLESCLVREQVALHDQLRVAKSQKYRDT